MHTVKDIVSGNINTGYLKWVFSLNNRHWENSFEFTGMQSYSPVFSQRVEYTLKHVSRIKKEASLELAGLFLCTYEWIMALI